MWLEEDTKQIGNGTEIEIVWNGKDVWMDRRTDGGMGNENDDDADEQKIVQTTRERTDGSLRLDSMTR